MSSEQLSEVAQSREFKTPLDGGHADSLSRPADERAVLRTVDLYREGARCLSAVAAALDRFAAELRGSAEADARTVRRALRERREIANGRADDTEPIVLALIDCLSKGATIEGLTSSELMEILGECAARLEVEWPFTDPRKFGRRLGIDLSRVKDETGLDIAWRRDGARRKRWTIKRETTESGDSATSS